MCCVAVLRIYLIGMTPYFYFCICIISNFQLPDPTGRAGGACTSTLLNVLYKDEQTPEEDLSFIEVLDQMRDKLKDGGYEQIPQLTSTTELDLTHKFDLVPDHFEGTKRAVMVGINYVGHDPGELVRIYGILSSRSLLACYFFLNRHKNISQSIPSSDGSTFYSVLGLICPIARMPQ